MILFQDTYKFCLSILKSIAKEDANIPSIEIKKEEKPSQEKLFSREVLDALKNKPIIPVPISLTKAAQIKKFGQFLLFNPNATKHTVLVSFFSFLYDVMRRINNKKQQVNFLFLVILELHQSAELLAGQNSWNENLFSDNAIEHKSYIKK